MIQTIPLPLESARIEVNVAADAFTPPQDVRALLYLVGRCSRDVVEIGANRGITTRQLAKATSRRVFAVDHMAPVNIKPEQRGEIVPAQDFCQAAIHLANVMPVHSDGAKFPYGMVDADFVFIDGDHSYNGVKDDTEQALKFVKDGIIAWHDVYPDAPRWCQVWAYLTELSATIPVYLFEGTHVAYAEVR